jgi:NAD(P)-dependent dehydrogenase (short-subunit alcohol dehydrogenase family)
VSSPTTCERAKRILATWSRPRAGGGLCEAIYCDVSDPSAVAAMAEDCIAKAGTVDVLVNNAGVLSVHPVWEIEPDEWDRMFDVNTKGTFLVTKAFLAHFRGRKVGRIINIASIGGKRGGAGQSHYCASKAAVINFTQVLAMEVAADGLTVNAVVRGSSIQKWGGTITVTKSRFAR